MKGPALMAFYMARPPPITAIPQCKKKSVVQSKYSSTLIAYARGYLDRMTLLAETWATRCKRMGSIVEDSSRSAWVTMMSAAFSFSG